MSVAARAQAVDEDGIYVSRSRHIPGIAQLGYYALKQDPIPRQRISWDKLQKLAEECVLLKGNFSMCSIRDGEVVAAVCALVHDQMVYERKQASVVQFYTKVPGEGVKLLKEFLAWARPQRKIKSIVFTVETAHRRGLPRLLKQLGMTSAMPVFIEWR